MIRCKQKHTMSISFTAKNNKRCSKMYTTQSIHRTTSTLMFVLVSGEISEAQPLWNVVLDTQRKINLEIMKIEIGKCRDVI